MNTNNLKRFAREARIKLIDQVGRKLEFVLSNADPVFIDTNASQIQSLKNKIQAQGKEQVIDMAKFAAESIAELRFNKTVCELIVCAHETLGNGYIQTSPNTKKKSQTVAKKMLDPFFDV